MRKPAAALADDGPPKDDPRPSKIDSTINTFVEKYKEACRRLDRRLGDLDEISAWKRDLEQRIARAQLRFTYVDCLTGEYDELADEVADFRAICFALSGKGAA